jgi:hypothetical protein
VPFVFALFADSFMADRLQLKNHALRLCLAVGLPASKDHTNTGFDLSWLGGGVRRAMQSAAHCTFGENARRTQPRQALHQAAEKLSFLPLGGSRGLQRLRKNSRFCLWEGAGGFSPLKLANRFKGL